MSKQHYYTISKTEYKKLYNYAYQIYHHWEEMQEAQVLLYNLMKKIEKRNAPID